MKRLGWGFLAFMICLSAPLPSAAIGSIETPLPKTSSPLLITGYSYGGAALRYVQVYNASSTLQSIDGWRVQSTNKSLGTGTPYLMLAGMIEPNTHIVISIPGLVEDAPFSLPLMDITGPANIAAVTLTAPSGSTFNDEVAV